MTGARLAQKDVAMSHRQDLFAVAGRIALAPLFVLSGISKLAAPAGVITYIGSAGLPFPEFVLWGTIAMELGVGTAMLIGYQTRLAAAALAVFTLAAAIIFHAELGDQNQFIHFVKNIAIAGGLLQLVAFGGGAYSVDAQISRTTYRSRATTAG